MNDKLVSVNHGQLVTDSRKVAEHFGKQHKDVLKAIDHLVAQNCATKDMFLEQTREYRGQNFRYYLMNRDGFSLLVMGFTGKAALEWKLKFLEAFNAMEKALREQQAVPKITPNPHYRTRMIKTAVKVTDLESHCTRDVNITLDNVPAMIYDILRQANDWIM